jgi:hypothetical protein
VHELQHAQAGSFPGALLQGDTSGLVDHSPSNNDRKPVNIPALDQHEIGNLFQKGTDRWFIALPAAQSSPAICRRT